MIFVILGIVIFALVVLFLIAVIVTRYKEPLARRHKPDVIIIHQRTRKPRERRLTPQQAHLRNAEKHYKNQFPY